MIVLTTDVDDAVIVSSEVITIGSNPMIFCVQKLHYVGGGGEVACNPTIKEIDNGNARKKNGNEREHYGKQEKGCHLNLN